MRFTINVERDHVERFRRQADLRVRGLTQPVHDHRRHRHRGRLLLAKLDVVAGQPTASALDQARECLAESLYPVADFLGFDVRGGVLQPSLEDVELVQ